MVSRLPAAFAAFLIAGAGATVLQPSGAHAAPKRIDICHGFGCYYRSALILDARDEKRFGAMLAGGKASPAAERAAISDAVRYYEGRIQQVTGVRDEARGQFGGGRVRGQMDCIDESTNTRALLLYLQERRMLRHHTVRSNISRGFLLDGRYPHFTAVIRDPGGTDWVVDSWYEPMGGPPDIMTVKDWKRRGVMGNRLPS
ncbi:MAG: hypothetical protein ABTQ30_11550 [Rhizobiaceae bacterium]